ncbi:MAG: hypothetical protein A2622_03620 [Bdellovibrionales bacterium RIFCSPHIGHO2_01_FULL_40_29]|nr:MAG: hypothetical protein A2622_03620 [Bdellovibrionales bacterium RIFCSPHIGHO2_01_FULL_40_29]OFZ35391.1 MAG: hypothetical protein A3D17_08410 [Bdellovibrionales bacterium RIFCSPHIGHO2_02_FULL_40_15]
MLNKIGFYQFDNLIQNRVPFLFINLAVDISPWYSSLGKMHLEKSLFATEQAELLPKLQSQQVTQHAAIVLLCNDGSVSMQIFAELAENGYTNVYVIDGGYQQLMTERSQA